MKVRITLALITIVLFTSISCSENKKPEKIKALIGDALTTDIEKLAGSEPISQLAIELQNKADKTITFDKSNINETLEKAKDYKKAFVIVNNHSLIKITDFDDCQKSTAWGACMPKGTALTQRSGDLEKKSDYINNLIGLPDNQKRVLYLFN